MKIDLTNKKALVTGSTSGMGYAIAKSLAAAGAAVVVHGRTPERVEAARARLTTEVPGAVVRGQAAELAERDAVSRLVAAAPEVDILVTSAGPTEGKPFLDIGDDEWQRYLDVYVMSAVRLARHYLRPMMDRGFGRVLFSAAVVSGFVPGEGGLMAHWGTCKAALLGLSRALAEYAKGTGVTVNAFLPGPAHSEQSFMSRARPAPGKSFAQIERDLFDGPLSSSALRRFAHPDEIAPLLTFLASEQASALTGAAIHVDGGIIRTLL
jgi:NAD(P)-dependent dehydrogenase (short-subunit alcohol dehydrogenase family)